MVRFHPHLLLRQNLCHLGYKQNCKQTAKIKCKQIAASPKISSGSSSSISSSESSSSTMSSDSCRFNSGLAANNF